MTTPQPPDAPELRLSLEIDFGGLAWSGRAEYPAGYLPGDGNLDAEGLTIRSVTVAGEAVPFETAADGRGINVPDGAGSDGDLVVEFSGTVETKNLFGLYRSPSGDGYVLTTHCEPTGARKIFPCVDRPNRKIRLLLTVRTAAGLEVVSNAAPHAHQVDGSSQVWTFEPTPPMSTYLFYLAVGKFDSTPGRAGRVALRVLSPPGRRDSGRWAAEMAPRVLEACEAYYGIPYPLPKLDLIAITEHAFGAMENWGAISFQETRLLFDASSSSFSRRDIVETIAHEIAHQWFGNLVTMEWWDDIWLNESFAALMETKITETIAPELDPWTDFFLRVAGFSAALDVDSLRSTHPIRAKAVRPEELSQIFDEISYGKGAGVLAMLDNYLGESAFRAGVKAYLERFGYANARTDALWASLEEASGERVAEIARPWTDRPGLPLVTATSVASGVHLSQRRFAYLGSTDEDPWPIPLVMDVDGTKRRLRLDAHEQTVALPPNATVHLNPGAIGFYRVLYEGDLFERLLRALPRRSAADRWTFLHDLGAFLFSGDVDWSTYTRAARALRDTDDRLVVETLAGTLGGLALVFSDHPAVVREAREFLAYQTERYGLDARPGEAAVRGILRDRTSYARVRIDGEFAAELSPRFDRWDTLDANLRSSVAIARVVAGGEAGYRDVQSALQAGGRPAEDSLRFARGLAASPDAARVEEVLQLAVSGGINRSHVTRVVSQAALNPYGREATGRWLLQRMPDLTEMFRGSGYLPILLDQVVPLVGLTQEAELRAYFQAQPTAEGERGLAKGLERLEIYRRLAERLPPRA